MEQSAIFFRTPQCKEEWDSSRLGEEVILASATLRLVKNTFFFFASQDIFKNWCSLFTCYAIISKVQKG